VADDDVIEIETSPPPEPFPFPDDWPTDVKERYNAIFSVDPDRLENRSRLGDLALDNFPDQLGTIRKIAEDLAQDDWENLPPRFSDQLPGQLDQVIAIMRDAADFSLEVPDPGQARNELHQRLDGVLRWFKDEALPLTSAARYQRLAANQAAGGDLLEQAKEAKRDLDALRKEQAEVLQELESYRDLVSGLRQRSGEEASSDLAAVFTERAKDVGEAAKSWRKALIAASLAALVGTLIAFELLKPETSDSDFTSSDIGRTTLLLLIVGLLIFGVRVCAQGYRSNRHLQAVAEGKAAALSTFALFSSSIGEDQIREAVALTLAQAVFATDDTGLIDGSSEQVTVVERILPTLSGQARAS